MRQDPSENRAYAPYSSDGKGSSMHVLLGIIIGVYLLEYVLMRWFGIPTFNTFMRMFSLSPEAMRHGHIWTLLSYSFLHQAGTFLHFHILLNSLALFFIGRLVYPLLGGLRFLIVYILAGILGGALWLLLYWVIGAPSHLLIGASASICGIFMVLALLQPDLLLRMPVFGFIFKLRTFAKVVVLFDIIGLLLFEIFSKGQHSIVAHSAHLGGYLAGWLYFRYLHQYAHGGHSSTQVEQPEWLRKTKNTPPIQTTVYISDQDKLRQEVDRILDKIHSEGIASLTEEEKQTLDEARKNLNSR